MFYVLLKLHGIRHNLEFSQQYSLAYNIKLGTSSGVHSVIFPHINHATIM